MNMNPFLFRLKTRCSVLAKCNSYDRESWQAAILESFPNRRNVFDSYAQYERLAEQDLYAAILEYEGWTVAWTGGSLAEDVTLVISKTDGTISTVKVIAGLNTGSQPVTRKYYNLAGFSVVSVKHFDISPSSKEGMILMSNGVYHETLTTDWAPGVAGSVKFIGHTELQSVFANEKFWQFYKKRVAEYRRPANNVECPVPDSEWQEPAISATMSLALTGLLSIGTGGGKTLIFAIALARLMDIYHNKKRNRIYTIVAPSLLLGRQTLEVVALCVNFIYGKRVKFLVINSAGDNMDGVEAIMTEGGCGNIPNTTSPTASSNTIQDARKKNIPLVVITTYMSQHVLYDALVEEKERIEMLVFDEAHNLVKGRLCGKPRPGQTKTSDLEYAEKLEHLSEHVRYFTATPPESFDGRSGFDLEGKHKLLYSVTNGELIRRGFILPLKPIYVDIGKIVPKNANGGYDLSDPHAQAMIMQVIYWDLQERIARDTKSPSEIAARLLGKFPTSLDLDAYNKSKAREAMTQEGISVYTISCLKGMHKDGVRYENSDFRHEYLRQQINLPASEPSMTGYVQMLGEGINVQTFNGLVTFEPLVDEILRNQTLGRVRRSFPDDLAMIRAAKPLAEELHKWRQTNKLCKPYAYVYILMWTDGSRDYKREIQKLLKRDFAEMMNEIELPVLVSVNVPDQLPAGTPGGGTFVANVNTPTDHSNIKNVELIFKSDTLLTPDDVEVVKAEIKAEREQAEEAEAATEAEQLAYEQIMATFKSAKYKISP